MSDTKTNVEQLHEAGALDKDRLHEDHVNAINQLSQEEVDHLKSINKKIQNQSGQSVGIIL
ncbi:aroma-sacti cluster domain-containing protein [Pseudocolwellia agarivorans]|uniref:aroma-sacti cluster domain-containing protein n=1 Tax=Pseudocolwellia agarivorans TaxID=1911682 RepID=UPI000984EF8C|nr:aroma-sacti cluster domain-containing protein [Pseudocolwellia agarivorans]